MAHKGTLAELYRMKFGYNRAAVVVSSSSSPRKCAHCGEQLERQRQNRIAKLRRLKALWDAQDDERHRRRAAEIAVIVEQDKAWLERERLWEERLAAIQNYYLGEREKEAQAQDKLRREECARIGKEIFRATARAERDELIRRGVYSGRGGSVSTYYNLLVR